MKGNSDSIEQCAFEPFFILVIPQVLTLVDGIFCICFFETREIFLKEAANKKKIIENIIPVATTHRQTAQIF